MKKLLLVAFVAAGFVGGLLGKTCKIETCAGSNNGSTTVDMYTKDQKACSDWAWSYAKNHTKIFPGGVLTGHKVKLQSTFIETANFC